MFCCGGDRLRGVSCLCFENKKPLSLLGTMVNNSFPVKYWKYFHVDDFVLYKNPREGKTGVLENKTKQKSWREGDLYLGEAN